jgi:lipopolysaccharide export system permease protein
MKLLDKYIAKTVLSAISLVTLMLIGLHGFILFVDQLNDLGKGNYDAFHAGWVVLLSLPYQIYLFFPVASLLGCLVGLGMLANHRELIVMRAAGMSITDITLAVFKAAVLLIVIVTVMGETCVPYLSKLSRDIKVQAMSGGKALRTSSGVWMRYHDDFLMLGQVISGDTLEHVLQFHFNHKHQLEYARKIDTARFIQGKWRAEGVHETRIESNKTIVHYDAVKDWDVTLNPQYLLVNQHEADEMTLLELHHYLKVTKRAKQSLALARLSYWQRIMQPITTGVMMILAIPFIFGPLRSSTMGAKLLTGVSVGFGFHLINRFFGPVSQVFQWPPELAAIGPTVVFALLGFYLMKRIKA